MVEDTFTNGKLSKKEKILFLIKFYIIFLVVFFILSYFGKYLIGIVTYLSYIFTKIIISDARLADNFIYLPNNTVEVVEECTGSFLIAGLLALIIVYSKNIKEFIIGIFFVLLAFFVNIFRIVLICYLVNMHPESSYLYHEIAGYGVILTLVPVLVIGYLKIIEKYRHSSNKSHL
ncbi:archaeosortase family protein ArtE [Methanocaldococcus jannaschii]|nr:archaeosortase family protein ArtE [Methanocaldococcus jannaschii]